MALPTEASRNPLSKAKDPLVFAKILWPDVVFYDKQIDIMYSVVNDDETIVYAGNMLGKDFVAGFITLWFFLTRHPCRIVTTSVDGTQLEGVLWGEIKRFIQTSAYPLSVEEGGPLVINHLHLKKIVKGKVCGLSYCVGRVAAKGEGMLGHHIAELGDGIPRTMFLADEASGVDDVSYERADTWARRKLVIGNPYPCNNFFYKAVKGGDIKSGKSTLDVPNLHDVS
jgi:phage terminase large subunit